MKEKREFYLTKEGLEKEKQRYEELKKIRMTKTSEGIPRILESDDLNPDYVLFHEEITWLDDQISELENILKNVVVINEAKSKEERNIIKIGSKILVEINGKEESEFIIVGTLEAKPTLGIISNESPVGKALLGRRTGEIIIVPSPVRTTYKIKRILS